MRLKLQQMPIQADIMVPFTPLAKFTSHENQFLSWLGKHVAKQNPKVCKLLPAISRHLIQERALTMNHLIVRKRQHVVFRKGIKPAEGQLLMVMLAVDWIASQVSERIVHPAHIPLVAKTQPSEIERTRYHGPSS